MKKERENYIRAKDLTFMTSLLKRVRKENNNEKVLKEIMAEIFNFAKTKICRFKKLREP